MKQFNIPPKSYSRFVVVKYICPDSQKICIQELTLHFTSLWKPIRGPVYDFPLTLCDRRTVDYASQATAMDIVTSDYVNENTRIYFDEKHKWYYWHGLQVDEVIAFIQADSQAENRAGMMDFTPIV